MNLGESSYVIVILAKAKLSRFNKTSVRDFTKFTVSVVIPRFFPYLREDKKTTIEEGS
jgi:hypothetical protein